MTRFSGKVALVTGAVGGIGEETCRRLINDGANVALLDINSDALQRTTQALGSSASAHYCDVSDETSVAAAIAEVVKQYGRIDIGVLNAGISGKRQSFQDVDVAAFDKILSVNTRGVFLGLKHLYPVMSGQGGGAIVVTASTEALRGNAGLGAYVASKHAVIGLVKTAALEWAGENIRVNCINPCPVDTPMLRAIEQEFIDKGISDVRQRYTARIPQQRYATTAEVASFIAFLASDEASFSTGGTYLVDGGVMAGAPLVRG